MHYIVSIVKGDNYGKVISAHHDRITAINKLENSNLIITTDEKLKKGEVYPELTAKKHAEQMNDDRLAFCISAKIAAKNNETFDGQRLAYQLHDMDPFEVMEQFGEAADLEIQRREARELEMAASRARMTALEKDICPDDRNAITISFPAVRGIQAGKEFFAAQVPFIQLEKMFVFDDEVLPAELRMQRELNTRRAVGISDYIVQNQRDYVLPALTSSVSARMWFDALPGNHGQRLGMLNIPLDAVMLINDGQHRRAGIEMAIRRVPTLKSEMVTVVFFYDEGLKRSQQIFSDINCKQVKPSSALSALFDHRDLVNIWLKEVIQGVPGLNSKIEKETASVGAKSSRLWSVVSFKKFLCAMCGVNDGNAELILGDAKQRKASIAFFIRFFNALAEHVQGWAPMMGGLLPAAEVREDMVIGHAVFLEALAVACRSLLLDDRGQPAWEACDLSPLAKLASINPNKNAPSWKYRAVTINGTMNKTAFGVMSTASILRGVMELALSPDMIKADALVSASYNAPSAA